MFEEACCHVAVSPGAFTRCWELQHLLHSSKSEHSLSIRLQRLVLSHHVIVNQTGMAEGVDPLPVLIERFIPLSTWVHKILDKFQKRHVIPFFQSFRLWVGPVPTDDLGSITLVESGVVAPGELVAVRRHQALKGLSYKDEFEVAAKALVDLGDGELRKCAEVSCHMGLIGRDGEGVSVVAFAFKDHQNTFPIGAGYLGYIAVNEAVFIIHNEVFEILR